MKSKLLVIIATGNKEKALAGLMYARNVLKYGWLNEVKVVFFGPSEKLVANNAEVGSRAEEIATMTACFACKAISDAKGVSEGLARVGITVDYVGDIVSNLIREDYVPIVW